MGLGENWRERKINYMGPLVSAIWRASSAERWFGGALRSSSSSMSAYRTLYWKEWWTGRRRSCQTVPSKRDNGSAPEVVARDEARRRRSVWKGRRRESARDVKSVETIEQRRYSSSISWIRQGVLQQRFVWLETKYNLIGANLSIYLSISISISALYG